MNQTQSRIVLTVFFLGLAVATAFLTYGLVPRVTSLKSESRDTIPRWKCIEVVSGDLLRVTAGDETNLVHVAGILAPPPARGSALERMAVERTLPVDEMLKRAQISRKSLTTWVYRRTVKVIPLPSLPPTHGEAIEAYVEVSGVDVGKKMLEHGQAFPSTQDHERAEKYRDYAAAAEAAGKGIWR